MKIKILIVITIISLGLLLLLNRPDSRPKIIFCDVGQGDGILIIKGTFEMLIDSGPKNGMMVKCLERYMPFWDKTIEAVIISHWDSDHAGGLEEVGKYYRVERQWSNEQKNSSTKLEGNDILSSSWFEFEILSNGGSFVPTGDDNDSGVVGVLKVNGKRILLTGDAGTAVEEKLVWNKILQDRIDILKASHHGSKEATSELLLKAIKPLKAIISVGKRNRFGHPSKEVIERLKSNNINILRTDESGDIVVDLE